MPPQQLDEPHSHQHHLHLHHHQQHSGSDNPYASSSTWRHQESSKFARHAAHMQDQTGDPTILNGNTADLARFLSESRIEPSGDERGKNHPQAIPITVSQSVPLSSHINGVDVNGAGALEEVVDGKEVVCGPLLNYRRMDQGKWHGSVLIVVKGGGKEELFRPSLVLQRAGEADLLDPQATAVDANGTLVDVGNQVEGHRLYSDQRNTFWAFDLSVPIEAKEIRYDYSIPSVRFSSPNKPRVNSFFIPASDESMRIMFHSCNGFSVGTDEGAWSGQALWNDVLRKHNKAPFHVMIGGGDQIYNDGIRVHGPLRAWTAIGNPKKRQEFPFPGSLRGDCDNHYLNNYIRWYNTGPFAIANGRIPQINIWDDHDIIDGFGSYVDLFMRCDVFRGIGGIAHKYYMLFQHHLPPPHSTYTSDHAPEDGNSQGVDPNQLIDTHVASRKVESPYIVGTKPGPYVAEHSHSIFTRLGARVALLGLDARTERTRHQVNYPETYNLVFSRLRSELTAAAAAGQPIRHLILLLGIPIAYPRLTWLENILRSPLIGPVKFMNRRFGVGGGLFNHFDGSVDLLDDLDDHYTARTHKAERRKLIEDMQDISGEFSVRVTILGGDVHLAALGRFYSNPKLRIPVEEDRRYMANVISSAIVNKPPPQSVANLLARRNKIHHLNSRTDETLLNLFDKDPGNSSKTASHNRCTMPSRNYAMLTENSPNNVDNYNERPTNGETNGDAESFLNKNGHSELHHGEVGCGTKHRSAADGHGKKNDGSLDIRINVEIDQHDPDGKTEGYGLTLPILTYRPGTGRTVSVAASTAADSSVGDASQ